MRTFDAKLVDDSIQSFKLPINFDTVEWVANDKNIALANDKNDVALFEYERPGIYTGHYQFKSRGRAALNAGKEFLDEVWQYGVEVIRGLTPVDNLGAKWISRQLGFKYYGTYEVANVGPHELFILHRTEHLK